MASTIKQRLRRFNGTDYDTIYLETDIRSVASVYEQNVIRVATVQASSEQSGCDFEIRAYGHLSAIIYCSFWWTDVTPTMYWVIAPDANDTEIVSYHIAGPATLTFTRIATGVASNIRVHVKYSAKDGIDYPGTKAICALDLSMFFGVPGLTAVITADPL